ncbi:MAG TPA: zinc-ribbon domain-containing protein [Methanoregulaceae archaeon]|nr:zinc-ribbon domain-containing protein [Methanoregulaceae archaeon]HPD74955.1 zinc-ribbon domain-containing protein [Methanoregulaceae archaeon]HRY76352.1 zinc-ribbon domain-containing protein [Methanoregulaceae archaeon]
MDDRRKSDEQAYLTTPDVVVKSVPFEATLTDRRIILVDTKDDLIPPKEIVLETIRRAEPGENAIRDPILTLSIVAGGETRQMILTFPQRKGATRKHERDEWASLLRDLIPPPVRKAPARPVPAAEPRKRIIEYSPAADEAAPQDTIRFRDEPRGRTAPAPAPREAEAPEPQPYGTFCSKCGNRLAPGSQFCNRCGARSGVVAGSAASVETSRARQDNAEMAPASGHGPAEPARQPAPYHEPPYETGRVGPHHREKRGFLSGLFSRKKKPVHNTAPSHPAPASRAPKRKSFSGPSKKTLVTIGVAAVAIVVVAVVGWFAMGFLSGLSLGGTGEPSGSGSGSATPTAGTTLAYNAASTVTIAKTRAPITIPAEGVALYVNYLGGWKGTYTLNGETVKLERSGEYVRELEDASGTVGASLMKKDGSSHELVVKIYKNGAELANGATTQANGEVTVSADVGVAAVTATPTITATKTTST